MRGNTVAKNAVYDDINQREACEGGYGEGKFGIETRKRSHGGEMNFSPPSSTPLPACV